MNVAYDRLLNYAETKMPNGGSLFTCHLPERVGVGLSIQFGYGFAHGRKPQQVHLAEHLSLNKGTEQEFREKYRRMEELAKGSTNACTDVCHAGLGVFELDGNTEMMGTIYVPAGNVSELVRYLGELTYSTDIRDDIFEKDVKRIIKEQRSYERSRIEKLRLKMSRAVWGDGHPYTSILDPTVRQIRDLTREDVLEVFDYWRGSNVVVAMAGSFTDSDVDEVIRQFGTYRLERRMPDIPEPAERREKTTIKKNWRGDGTSRVILSYRLPPANTRDFAVAHILEQYLGEQLYAAIESGAISYTRNTQLSGYPAGSSLTIEISELDESDDHVEELKEGETERVLDIVTSEIEKVRHGETEIRNIQDARTTVLSTAMHYDIPPLGALEVTTRRLNGRMNPTDFFHTIEETTSDDVIGVAEKYLVNPVIGITLPKKKHRKTAAVVL